MIYKDYYVKPNDVSIDKDIISVNVKYLYSTRNYLKLTNKKSNANKKMAIIMMNPSQATDKKSDQTVSEVLRFAKREEYKEVVIFNVLPFYGTNSDDLIPLLKDETKKADIETLMENNITEINEKILEEKDLEIFLATGCPKNSELKKFFLGQLQKIYELLQNNLCVHAFSIDDIFLREKVITYHPMYLKIKKAFTTENIVDVVVKQDKGGSFLLDKPDNAHK